MSLTLRILIGLVAGAALGAIIQSLGVAQDHWLYSVFVGQIVDAAGTIFINSLKLMVVPLVLVSLTVGAASLGATGRMGALGGKAVGLYLLTTAIAVTLALTLALIISPGAGASDVLIASTFEAREAPSLKDTFIGIFPTNPVAAMAQGKMLQIIVFALLMGFAISAAGSRGKRILGFFEDVNEVLMQLIRILIKLAPYGVFFLMVRLAATVSLGDIALVGVYFINVILVLLLHGLLVYPFLLAVVARVNPVTFFLKMREPLMVAFSTSSSGATLPVTLRTVEEKLGVSNQVASFSVPLGATINMDGTAIMQGVATVFIAQFYGVGLEVQDYVMVVLTATLASIGTAAVPGVGLVMLTMVLTQVGLPVEGISLIIGVDRLLDMMRTAVNVCGDGTVATVVARSEGELDMDVFNDPEAGMVIPDEPEEGRTTVSD